MYIHTCQFCGCEYESVRPVRKQCGSDSCRKAYNSKRMREGGWAAAYSKNNRIARRATDLRRNAKKREVYSEHYTADELIEKLEDHDHRCTYCGMPVNHAGRWHWDHVIPISKGGPDTLWNIVPACHICNSSKRDLSLEEWLPFALGGRYARIAPGGLD